jgi:alkanesulfonate monooxygenase SsuD/methylene tetrahydromethanopterin reductase-like flavin-dependent oxidoreductase (luciferase family)
MSAQRLPVRHLEGQLPKYPVDFAPLEKLLQIRLRNATSLIGSRSQVLERLELYREAGVTGLVVRPASPDPTRQLADVAELRDDWR